MPSFHWLLDTLDRVVHAAQVDETPGRRGSSPIKKVEEDNIHVLYNRDCVPMQE